MTLPPPPTDNFSAQQNVNALIGLRVLRAALEANPFPRDGQAPGTPVQTFYLDVWVLDGPAAGQFYSDSKNSSALGRQFANEVGNGQVYYGRVTAKQVGQGTSLYLREPDARDQPVIDWHKGQLVQQGQLGQPPQQPQQPNQMGYQQPPQQPQHQQPQPQQPAYTGGGYGGQPGYGPQPGGYVPPQNPNYPPPGQPPSTPPPSPQGPPQGPGQYPYGGLPPAPPSQQGSLPPDPNNPPF